MSLRSALSLSFNNLLTKKGRTFLTAFAGSIGIIGIALILALSNGVNKYAKNLEKDSLSDYPITIERKNVDLFGSLSSIIDEAKKVEKCDSGKLCSQDDIVKETVGLTSQGMVTKNNLEEFKKYLDKNEEIKEYSTNIVYGYNLELKVYTKDYEKINPSDLLKDSKSIFTELSTVNDKKYDLLAGNMPKNYDEIVLVVGENNKVNDSNI